MSFVSPLGPARERKKTDVRMPVGLSATVEHLASLLGVPKGTLITLATTLLVVQLLPIAEAKDRTHTLNYLVGLFQKTCRAIAKIPEKSSPSAKQ